MRLWIRQHRLQRPRPKGRCLQPNQANADEFEGCPAKAVDAMGGGRVVTHWNGRQIDVGNAIKDNISAFWNGAIDAATAEANMVAALSK